MDIKKKKSLLGASYIISYDHKASQVLPKIIIPKYILGLLVVLGHSMEEIIVGMPTI